MSRRLLATLRHVLGDQQPDTLNTNSRLAHADVQSHTSTIRNRRRARVAQNFASPCEKLEPSSIGIRKSSLSGDAHSLTLSRFDERRLTRPCLIRRTTGS